MGKGDKYRPYKTKDYDVGWYNIFGFCNKFKCPKSNYCRRFIERYSKNNVSYVPVPDIDKCKFYSPAPCDFCGGKGYYRDWCNGKEIETKCLFCGGKGKGK